MARTSVQHACFSSDEKIHQPRKKKELKKITFLKDITTIHFSLPLWHHRIASSRITMFRITYIVILFLVTLSHSWSSLFTVFSFILSTPHIQTHTCSHRYGHISSLIGNTICFLQFPGRMSTATPLYNGIVFSNSFAHIILAFAFKSTREFSLIEVDFRNEHFVYLTLGT